MTLLTASELFGETGVPLRVLDTTTTEPSGAVIAESVKVIFTLAGWAEVRTRDEAVAASTGTILTVPTGLECIELPEGHSRAVTFYLHPVYLADQMRWLPHTHPLVHHLHRAAETDVGLQRLQLSRRAMVTLSQQLARLALLPHRPENDFARLSIASDVFDGVGRFAGASARRIGDTGPTLAKPRDEVVAAINLMRHDLARPWRMDGLAKEVALSASQLARLFKSQIGVSPAACLAGLRAERMAELLGTRSIGVADAAHAAGWPNITVASRVFKKRYGLSPREYAAFARQSKAPPLGEQQSAS